jgi:NADH dehydrogenase [ubiquinone] 1 alpha subcomplex assembly factor 7
MRSGERTPARPAPGGDGSGGQEARLRDLLTRRIARAGPLTVAEYMAACLADPRHGYWRRSSIGAAGDFVTAPEISQIFGELIGLWCAVLWQGLGSPECVHLVELGPGRGTLMRDALRAAAASPPFLRAAHVHLIEASAAMRAEQRARVAPAAAGRAAPIAWHASLADVPPGAAIVIANEFLDALPIRQLVFSEHGWRERVVLADGRGGLAFATGAVTAAITAAITAAGGAPGGRPRPGDVCELRRGEQEILADLVARSGPLVALFIDYGPSEEAYGDTLQAVSGHRYVDPLASPGQADLTAHVQFAALRARALAAGLAADGPLPQAEFLARLGILERTRRLMTANPRRAGEIESGVARLMSPTGMGGLMKALAVRSPHLPPAPAFG